MYKKSLIFFIILLILPISYAAKINGNLYDSQLNPLTDVILEVNSIPKQTYVSKDNTYSFNLPEGNYIIKAEYTQDYQKIVAEESIIIKQEGDYILDLILFPDLSEETELLESNPEINIDDIDTETDYILFLIPLLILLIIILIFFFKRKPKKKIELDEPDQKQDVLKFIKENQGRLTQKEIRKKFPLSEAKISLILTELEEDKVIRKIKRGKGNIIILNK